MGRKTTSERRKQRRHYLKQVKKKMSAAEYKELKTSFKEEGKRIRMDDLRESLEKEKESLANQEGEKRRIYKEQGLSKKEINQKIENWYNDLKIWSLHSDVMDELI